MKWPEYVPASWYIDQCTKLCNELNAQYGKASAVIVKERKGKDLKFYFRGDLVFTSPSWDQAHLQLQTFIRYHNPFSGYDK